MGVVPINVLGISSNTMAYRVPVLRILSLRRFFVRISSFHFLYSILVWWLHAYVTDRYVMGFRVCGRSFPCSCCLSYCRCSLAEYLYLCEVCRWMNTDCSLSRFFLCGLCLSCIICTIDVSILQIPSVVPPQFCHLLLPLVVPLWSSPNSASFAKSLIPFGRRVPAPLLYSVNYSLF